MKAYDSKICRLIQTEKLTADVYDFTVECPGLAEQASPGQFAQIRLPGHVLRRPISICGINRERNALRFVFQIRGKGTAELAEFRVGDEIEILAPLGRGFPVNPGRKTLLIGGGIGVPPLLGAAAELRENAVTVLGFRNRGSVILKKDFEAVGSRVEIATDDGSYGFHGLVTELAAKEEFETVFACGPMPMLRAVREIAKKRGVPCFLSLEERMACGIGACLGCAVALLDEGGKQYYGHVCKDGPVFDGRKVVF